MTNHKFSNTNFNDFFVSVSCYRFAAREALAHLSNACIMDGVSPCGLEIGRAVPSFQDRNSDGINKISQLNSSQFLEKFLRLF